MILRRPRPQLGQIPFELPMVRDDSKPSVILHKNGRYLLFKPQSPKAAILYADMMNKIANVPEMRDGRFWNISQDGQPVVVKDWKKIELWRHLEGDVTKHPMCRILQERGVEIGVAPSLAGYIKKEYKRFLLENTPYPTPVLNNTVSLYERCSVGTILRCTKGFTDPTYTEFDGNFLFEEGKHYMVVSSGSNGSDALKISTTPVGKYASVTDAADDSYEWSEFNEAMEVYFDDSEDTDLGPTVLEAYPERVAEMRKRIDELGYDLFSHVKIDAAMEALKRGSINGKLMRMGKTSEALTVLALWGSKKVAVFGSMNVCMTWAKECDRLGITDYVMVNQLSDLEKPGRLYLMRYGWIRREDDPTARQRKERTNYLAPANRFTLTKVGSKTVSAEYSVLDHHPCPHCSVRMVRPLLRRDATGKVYRVDWTPQHGYMCRNKECYWTSDNRKKKGAAWAATSNRLVRHQPGTYVDWGLAAHAYCGKNVQGRKCMSCGETDGVWIPQVTKRFKKRFTAVVPDEIHNIKDHTSQTYQAVSRMRARRKFGMTGTFISNGPTDAYWILLWLLGGANQAFPFDGNPGANQFRDRFCDWVTLEKPAGIDEETGEVLKKTVRKPLPFLKNPADWWRFISPKFLRRNYTDPLYEQSLVDAGMFKPDIEIKKLECAMTPQQIQLMLSALKNFKDVYEKHKLEAETKNKDINKAFVISQMSAMCKIATAPESMNDKFGVKVYEGPDGGGKMYPIVTLARNRVLSGGKVLILSDYIAMQKGLEKEFVRLGIKVIRFNPSWSLERRREAQEQFAEDPEYSIMIAGTRAVSESLDFSIADTCICCDLLWAPAFQQQAWSRILQATKRMRQCEIFLAMSKNSIDEHKYDTFYAKFVASEQSQDRRVVSRRAMTVDIKWFADRVIEEQSNLTLQLRDLGVDLPDDNDDFMLPDLNAGIFEARTV